MNLELEIDGAEPGPCFEVPTIGVEMRAVAAREHGDVNRGWIRLGVARSFEPERDGWVADELDRRRLGGMRVVVVELYGVCGGLCGSGEDHAVALVEGQWLYLGSEMTWTAAGPRSSTL